MSFDVKRPRPEMYDRAVKALCAAVGTCVGLGFMIDLAWDQIVDPNWRFIIIIGISFVVGLALFVVMMYRWFDDKRQSLGAFIASRLLPFLYYQTLYYVTFKKEQALRFLKQWVTERLAKRGDSSRL